MASTIDESEVPLTSSGTQIQIVSSRRKHVDSGKDMPIRKAASVDSQFMRSEGKRLIEIFFAEFTGTGILILLGCMSQIVWSESEAVHAWQGSVVFAVVVTTVIQIFGHITNAHLNPAVTLCFYILGDITVLQAIVFVFAEVSGSIVGFGILKFITPCDIYELSMQYSGDKLCVTYPNANVSDVQAIAAEFFATTVLVLVVCSCSDTRNAGKGDSGALKFGATILALCIAEGPYTGASMNPARSLGPVVWTGAWGKHWIYWLAPLSAGFLATIFYMKLFGVKTTPLITDAGRGKENSGKAAELKNVTSH